jgi:outer membrane protein OmpA-like peptidoglycan-associated protein
VRALALAALLPLLCACAGSVTLLPGEGDTAAGAVAVFDPKTGLEKGSLSDANTRSRLGRRITAKPADPKRYVALTDRLPPPLAHFTLYFYEDTTKLVPQSEAELKRMFGDIARRPGVEVQIVGHTDTVGSGPANDILSLDRARKIRDALVAQGLRPAITRAVGRGEHELLVPTPDNTEEPRNRRVEVIVR